MKKFFAEIIKIAMAGATVFGSVAFVQWLADDALYGASDVVFVAIVCALAYIGFKLTGLVDIVVKKIEQKKQEKKMNEYRLMAKMFSEVMKEKES